MKSLQLTPNALLLIAGFLAYGIYKFLFFTTLGSVLLFTGILLACTSYLSKQKANKQKSI